jgi:hypothetical protein
MAKIEQQVMPPPSEVAKIKISNIEVNAEDPVVQMLNSYRSASLARKKSVDTLEKLIERVGLDRPIMQSEKIDLILKEKGEGGSRSQELSAEEIRN